MLWIDEQTGGGGTVPVHCRFGIGRTGTIVAAYLMSQGYGLKSALRLMSHTPSVPTSFSQWDLLDRYSVHAGVSQGGVPQIEEKIETPADSFFKKWNAMVDWYTE